jgi:competence protein ComEA
MNFENTLPKEVEKRWNQLRDQFEPLELSEKNKLVHLWKFDAKAIISLLVILLSAIILSIIWWSSAQWKEIPQTQVNEIAISETVIKPKEVNTPAEIYIHIYGDVAAPGVYILPFGARTFQAIEAAGGQTRERTLTLNLAQILNDGDQIFIGEESNLKNSSSTGHNTKSTESTTCVNLNNANLSTLETLPGIGPVMGQKIIDWRDINGGFKNIADLKKIKGIGDAKFSDLAQRACI